MKLLPYWHRFVHWRGWRVIGHSCAALWCKVLHWTGWKALFSLPMSVLLLLSAVCSAGLIWVFAKDLVQSIGAYLLYPLSAYCLAALCIRLPAGIQRLSAWVHRHPRIHRYLTDKELSFSLALYFDQFLNFGYGIFKTVSGIVLGSAWIGCDGIYNLAQAGIQLFQILRRKAPGSLSRQWKSYRFSGVLILLMHLTLTGIVFQMINWNRAEDQGQILVITTAAFAFYKFISSFISIAKDRKHLHPIDSSVRMLKLSQAIFAIFSLQASLLHTFGSGESWEQLLNTISGCTVCLLIVAMGIYMIHRGTRELKKEQE